MSEVGDDMSRWRAGLGVIAAVLLLAQARSASASTIVGDVNGDCAVNGLDLSLEASRFLTARGSLLYSPTYDLNGDGVVNILDIQIVASHFGTTC